MVDEPDRLLSELRRCGGRAELTSDSVRFAAPKGAVPAELAAALSAQRREVAALVVEEELARLGLYRCSQCRRIMSAHYLAEGVCDDCRTLPASPLQTEMFEEA